VLIVDKCSSLIMTLAPIMWVKIALRSSDENLTSL
jgi:hypothetical protein